MKIAMVNSFYRASQPSGENRIVQDQVQALREDGHEVLLVRRDTDELASPLYGMTTALHVAVGSGFDPTESLRAFQPDIVHVQNLFPNIGSNWTTQWPGPLVMSLHNYRLWCSNGFFFREGNVCLECPKFGSARAVVHGCYRNSRIASIPVAVSRSRERRQLLYRADAIVTTSEFSDELVRSLLHETIHTEVIPNFGPDSVSSIPKTRLGSSWIALGRFTPEKGFVELVRDWPHDERLVIIGGGPQEPEIVAEASGKAIEVVASLSIEAMRDRLSQSIGLVVPSRWFEVDPQVVVEAMRLGIPVVALAGSSVAQIVSESRAGAVYGNGLSLLAALQLTKEFRDTKSRAALAEYSRRWTKKAWLRKINNLYSDLLSSAGSR